MVSLSLGTASFVAEYGVANDGRPAESEVAAIIAAAEGRIAHIDTAPAYGCQRLLGRYMSPGLFRLTTKTADGRDAYHTLTELRTRSLHAILLHDPENLDAWPELVRFRAAGWADKIGVSCYTEADVRRAMDLLPQPDVIQAPVSMLDRRLVDLLREIHGRGIEIQARSVFLQGSLLMAPAELPAHLAGLAAPLGAFRRACARRGLTPLQGALGYVLGLDFIDLAVVGVNSAAQLAEVLAVEPLDWEPDLPTVDEVLLDPRRWLA